MRHTVLRLGATVLLLVLPPAAAQIYKQTDPSGRVVYSDKPPAIAIGAESAFRDLEGMWSVANVTFEGAPDFNSKLTGSTWSFAKDELHVQRRDGELARYLVRMERTANPKAFALTPVAPNTEPAVVMIYAREGARLRLAFLDGMAGRPTGFEPQRKQAVVTLVSGAAGASAKLRSACDILRAAGIFELLGAGAQPDTRRVQDPVMQCRMAQPGGAVTLVLLPATQRSALDKEREKQDKAAVTRAVRTVVQDEPELGAAAFSVRMGNTLTFIARRGDVMVTLMFEVPAPAQARAKSFAQRVLELT